MLSGPGLRSLLLLALLALAPHPARAGDGGDGGDGLHLGSPLHWQSGDHRVDLGLDVRFRTEAWDAHAGNTSWFTGTRTRVRLGYTFRERFRLVSELQDVRLQGLGDGSSGAAALYRANSGLDGNPHGTDLRQLYVEGRFLEKGLVRLGRQDIKLGTEVLYPEGDWKYLKVARASQRLVGTVGWTNSERANDGLALAADLGGHHVFGFVARPTTGVFDVDSAYRTQHDINYGGLSWTVKRDTWLEATELRFFALGYGDDRSTSHGGLSKGVEVYTAGASLIGIHPLGPGKADVLVWLAGQLGDYDGLDHRAAAGIVEVGYQLPELPLKPWLRLGVNAASGDGDPGDGDHETFFNMLPTNHLYYGFADRLAFQNLLDAFVQLRLKPHARVGIDVFFHRFSLLQEDDARYFGTGAFNERVFGFGAQPSRGFTHVGNEVDVVANVSLAKFLGLQVGYGFLDGGALLGALGPDPDVQFGYVQLKASY
jgi:hypothetical protein